MISSFHALNTARNAVMVNQRLMDTTSHNVANANTPGYSRQRASLSATQPTMSFHPSAGGFWAYVGTGVKLDELSRVRDGLVDNQFRSETSTLNQWQTLRSAITQAEAVFGALTEGGLGTAMDNFWAGWQEVSTQPESIPVRRVLLERASVVASSFGRQIDLINGKIDSVNSQIVHTAPQINDLAEQIAQLNKEIRVAVAANSSPNDLLDRRDQLIDELSGLTRLVVRDGNLGQVNVFIGSRPLVQDDRFNKTQVVLNGATGNQDIQWASDGTNVDIAEGTLGGLLTARDTYYTNYRNRLNTLASSVITEVNNIHQAAFGLDDTTGLNFFSGTDATNIAVSAVLVASPEQVGTSDAATAPGNAVQARAIAALRDALTMAGNTLSMNDYLRDIVVELGADENYAASMEATQLGVISQIEEQRRDASGVSIDEELANMIQFQRAYEASARLVTAVDEMLGTIIQRMGLVGRA